MSPAPTLSVSRGVTDDRDRLLSAEDELAALQKKCGGHLPGKLAVPQLLELVQQSRLSGTAQTQRFSAFDGDDRIMGVARIRPLKASGAEGCEVAIEDIRRERNLALQDENQASRIDKADRIAAEATARLDRHQCILVFTTHAADARELEQSIKQSPGSLWTDHLNLKGLTHELPLHWRLMDGIAASFEGSSRDWRVRLLPIGNDRGAGLDAKGFELLLIAEQPLSPDEARQLEKGLEKAEPHHLIGGALLPALKQPITRIIANAETIRAKLAGPLRAEYSEYAGNIAFAGKHLTAMLEDLADLEMLEADDFSTISEPVDLIDAAARAAGILGVRAQARSIQIEQRITDPKLMASAEFRRVLQILINLIGNAIAYSPDDSVIALEGARDGAGATVTIAVSDEGPGISEQQAARIFDKFERLGRSNAEGSGLGLYISKRLADAMEGRLEITNREPQGARFALTLPAFDPSQTAKK